MVAVAIAIAITSALTRTSGTYGLAPASAAAGSISGSNGSLLARETAVLTRKGISPAHAIHAIGVQSEIAQTRLVREIYATLGDAFAGVWFAPASAQLHVGVTSTAIRHTVERLVARTGLTANVVETPVHSTWAQLEGAQAKWNRRLAGLFLRSEVETSLAPQSNAVSVTLASSVPHLERVALERDALHTDSSVEVKVASGPQITAARGGMATECNVFKTNAAYCNKTLTSGVRIQSQGGAFCSAGPMAIPKTSKSLTYVITAGHCIKGTAGGGNGGKWFAFTRGGTKQEIGPAVEFFDETKADVGAILVNNPGFWVNSSKDPVFADTAEWTKNAEISYPVEREEVPVVGKTDCHEGQTTGQRCGEIMALNRTINFGGELVEGLIVNTASGEKGDSGGPLMFITTKANSAAFMEGTYEGQSEEAQHTPTYYEPLRTVFQALTKLNLELLTTANETRP